MSAAWNRHHNADSAASVAASASGSTVTLTAKTTGSSTNYSLSASSTSQMGFSPPSFTAAPSGSALSGGQDPVYTTVYDSGTVQVTVNGFQASASYGQASTAASVASAIANVINTNPSSPVTASVAGATLTLTAQTAGASTNYPLTSGSQTTQGSFSSPSFTTSTSGASLTGGRDAGPGNIYYYLSDILGSARTLVQAGQTSPCYDADFYPFGGERVVTSTCPQNYKFTGKERDSESGLDNFGKRYDSSSLGRFMTTDPVVITTERLKNPQQLNLYAYVVNNPLRFIDPTGEILRVTGDPKADYDDLCKIAGDACNRLKIDEKTGNVTFDTTGLDLSKNEGAALVNDLVSSKNTYEFSSGPTVMTDKGPVKIDYITANLPWFGDQVKTGNPRLGVSDVVALYFNNPKVTRASNTNLKVAPEFTVAFHELAEAYEKIDGGKGGSYAAGHDAALQRERKLRDQRPYLKEYNTGAGGPANSPNPEGGIIIKQ